jgi:hypothetical protein
MTTEQNHGSNDGMLFDIPGTQEPASAIGYPHPLERDSHRLPEDDRVSSAHTDLGGGTSAIGSEEPPRESATTTPNRSRPTGHVRDTEPSDSELDPEMHLFDRWPTNDEASTALRGVALARKGIWPHQAGLIHNEYGDNLSHEQAVLRARAERRK